MTEKKYEFVVRKSGSGHDVHNKTASYRVTRKRGNLVCSCKFKKCRHITSVESFIKTMVEVIEKPAKKTYLAPGDIQRMIKALKRR